MSAAEILTSTPPATKPKPAIALVVTPNLVRLRHDQLQASPLNPRKHKPSPEQIEELAESIASRGILQNLVARPLKGSKDKYELAAGETRWRAVAKLIADKRATAGYLMPVSVRELADEDVIEIGLVENGRRNDLHPLDEARAFHALYTARMKDGRKAIGDVVNGLAQKIGKSVRYVQKRMAIARNLVPDATKLLESGTINVHVAQTLAMLPAAEQKDKLENYLDVDDEPDVDALKRLTAKDVMRDMVREWRPMAHAVFNRAAYTGPTEEIEGEIFATDAKAFDKLQQDAIAGMVKGWKKLAETSAIAFFETGRWFDAYKYDRKADRAGTPDPKGGIFLEKTHDGEFRIHKGLFKNKATIAREKADAAYRSSAAKAAAKSRNAPPPVPLEPDPRVPVVVAFCAKAPATLMALDLANVLGTWDSQVHWIGDDSRWNKNEDGAIEILKKLRRGPLPKGADLLKWLLKQKLADLAPAWAVMCAGEKDDCSRPIPKPSKAELVLFDHCGAKLPPKLTKNAKTAGGKLTASKSKPTKTKKGKKS